MRYTEARSTLAEELMSEIGMGTTIFRLTYDGQLSEPIVVPAQVPNPDKWGVGIAVGWQRTSRPII